MKSMEKHNIIDNKR